MVNTLPSADWRPHLAQTMRHLGRRQMSECKARPKGRAFFSHTNCTHACMITTQLNIPPELCWHSLSAFQQSHFTLAPLWILAEAHALGTAGGVARTSCRHWRLSQCPRDVRGSWKELMCSRTVSSLEFLVLELGVELRHRTAGHDVQSARGGEEQAARSVTQFRLEPPLPPFHPLYGRGAHHSAASWQRLHPQCGSAVVTIVTRCKPVCCQARMRNMGGCTRTHCSSFCTAARPHNALQRSQALV